MKRRPPFPSARKPAVSTVTATNEQQYRRALQCYEQGRYDEAFAICEGLRSRPDFEGGACLVLGCIYLLRRQPEAAESALRIAVQKLGSADAWFNLALALTATSKPEEIEEAYRKTLELNPKQPQAWNNLGNLLRHGHSRERLQEALECYRRAIELQPDYALAHVNLGFAYKLVDQKREAEWHYRKAMEVAPDFTPALTKLAELLKATKRSEEALSLYRKAWELEPNQIARMADFVAQRRRLADWSDAGGPQPADLIAAIKSGKNSGITPLPLLALPEVSPDLLRDTTASFSRLQWGYELSLPPLVENVADTRGRRIRVGYLSADFRNHAVTHLITDVIAHHDRERFEVFLYAYGPEEEDEERRALRRLAEHFMSVSTLGDGAAAEKIRADGIDLLIDLTGFTTNARLGITARRPAAVIASWLGYIGSLGEPRLADYIIGDMIATPPERVGDFSESLALMPHCFQPNRALTVAMPAPDRQTENLPGNASVFCSFNQCFKLTPALWDDWCRILSSTGNSVLWLAPMEPVACNNLQREAIQRGIAPERLVFAKWRSLAEHQGRVPLADLALDTWPYNSGTTASDALRAGVPLVTLNGDTFAGRMGASLLHNIGLDELIAKDRAAYIDLAVALATDKARLHALRATLASRLPDSPLFDPQRFCRDLERLFQAMLDQRARGESGIVRA
ncbi:MAG: tetratricopeptide repeat protein [Desulfobulbaceae bacterium]|jgi:predicted O-linked N-acetylglucosamine transferase (SPINDLY family)|nr:tetratricopeptide repeat protein [Desulfobulbaceae bacterium]